MKVAFVHIPKTGGGSIHQWLKDNHKDKFEYHTGHRFLHEIIKDNGNCDFSFTCTRNTYNRMVSLYVWTGIKNLKKLNKSYRRNVDPTEYLGIQQAYEKGIIPFLHYIKVRKPMLMEPQTTWIKGVDVVLSLENINKDFKIIQNKLNAYNPIIKEVHKMDYVAKDFYSAEFKRVVDYYFGEEIEYFKYLSKY